MLSQGYGQVEPLHVQAQYAIAGAVDLSGSAQGVTYQSQNELVAAVTRDGQVVARANGETDLLVGYAGYSETVHVIVDSTAQLQGVELLPSGASIPRVGKSIALRFEGALSDGRRVDLTPGAFGTHYASSDPTIVAVSDRRRGHLETAGLRRGHRRQRRARRIPPGRGGGRAPGNPAGGAILGGGGHRFFARGHRHR